ncbi:MAG: Zn-finger-like domain containing protein [Candidatus Methanohalarchaeum thermophilum]|uniref:Zn-finger-like domain containing protein n=1 Tax=Methanohalarchaeum thermophilum TaxID=1903181 RepID=A0A1Q6DVT3_METT1|nr:MAG: Zn-finger-like domain containing protein [Candidatus Methanohalarchaeum thermophilum]
MRDESFKFFQNRECQFFPCHDVPEDEMNCKYCYCPLYPLEDCGGDYEILENGVKDCSDCKKVHRPGAHEYVTKKLKEAHESGEIGFFRE